MRVSRAQWLVLLPVLLSAGCRESARSEVQRKYDAPTAAAIAIETYDTNDDGELSAEEVKSSPALAVSGSRVDRNGDGTLTADEIRTRMEAIDAQSDLIGLDVRVSFRNRPLVGAAVTLTPEPFMGEGLQAYTGITIEGGGCPLNGEKQSLPGVPVGFYQATIVHEGNGITLVRGCEIADDVTGNRLRFEL